MGTQQNRRAPIRSGTPGTHLPLSEFRQVTVVMMNGSENSHIVHSSQVEAFVEAQKRLHFSPGVNPHNGNRTSEAGSIAVAGFESAGPFWWTTPDLAENGDQSGARLMQTVGRGVSVWVNPALQARLDAEDAEMLRMEACA